MSLLHGFLPTNRNAEVAGTTPTHTDGGDSPNNIMRAPNASVSGRRDTVRLTLPDKTLSVAETTPRYIYYRLYAEDGAIPSKTPVAPGDPFLGRIKARSVPPPHTAKAVKRSIAKVEDIKDRTSTSLFLTSYSQSPMGDADKVTIRNRTGPGSTPQEPLALVAKMSESERSALESDGRGGHANTAAEPDTIPQEIRYQELSLGRIRADSVVPPHSPASIKRCISRVERTPALIHADLFADTSCDAPLEEGYISILRTDGSGPGLSPIEPMAIVHIESPSIPDGIYLIKNRAANLYWNAGLSPTTKLYFGPATMKQAKKSHWAQWHITNDTNGNISMTSPYAPFSWVGAEITGSAVPVPWRLISADSKYYYLTTDMNRSFHNPRVPAAQQDMGNAPGLMATLKEGDRWQMWEFIRMNTS